MDQSIGKALKKLIATAVMLLAVFHGTSGICAGAPLEVWGVDVLKYGIYSVTEQQVEKVAQSPGGEIHVVTAPRFSEQTFRIPAVLGTRFGFRYIINGVPPGAPVPITIRKAYPGLKDPNRDDILHSHQYTRIHKIGQIYGTGYGFDHPWELVSGTWTFQLFYKEKVLGEMAFEIFNPR